MKKSRKCYTCYGMCYGDCIVHLWYMQYNKACFESITIIIDVLLSCTCNSILQNFDMYFLYVQLKKKYLNAY